MTEPTRALATPHGLPAAVRRSGPTAGSILGVSVDALSMDEAVGEVMAAAETGLSFVVCATNVHMVMEAHDDPRFREIVNGADLALPDGMPLVWLLRRAGFREQRRVAGPDLLRSVCAAAAKAGVPVGFYGGSPETLDAAVRNLTAANPGLGVAVACSPPFRPLSPAEDEEHVERINASGARILFVALGCPRQERWMDERRGRIRCVMLGVGAALDFAAGTKPRAPGWLRERGLEWLFRLAQEPRRLAARYLRHNPRFLWLARLELSGGFPRA